MALSFKRRALSLVFALVLSALLSGLLLLLLSFLLYKLRFSGEYASAGVFAVYGLSCLAGGFFAGKQLKTRRFIWGGLCGLLYFALLLALSLLTESCTQAPPGSRPRPSPAPPRGPLAE